MWHALELLLTQVVVAPWKVHSKVIGLPRLANSIGLNRQQSHGHHRSGYRLEPHTIVSCSAKPAKLEVPNSNENMYIRTFDASSIAMSQRSKNAAMTGHSRRHTKCISSLTNSGTNEAYSCNQRQGTNEVVNHDATPPYVSQNVQENGCCSTR